MDCEAQLAWKLHTKLLPKICSQMHCKYIHTGTAYNMHIIVRVSVNVCVGVCVCVRAQKTHTRGVIVSEQNIHMQIYKNEINRQTHTHTELSTELSI